MQPTSQKDDGAVFWACVKDVESGSMSVSSNSTDIWGKGPRSETIRLASSSEKAWSFKDERASEPGMRRFFRLMEGEQSGQFVADVRFAANGGDYYNDVGVFKME